MASSREVVTSFPFFQFTANLEQSECWITQAYSLKLTFSLIVAFYLTKTGNRTKKFLTQVPHIALSKGTIFPKSYSFFGKLNVDISRVKRALILISIFSETISNCVCMYQISNFYRNINKF